jgi:restriction endonuclease S subunit
MGRRFVLELCLDDNAIRAAEEYQVNIPQVAIEAILQTLDAKNQLNNHLDGLSPTLENRAIKELLREALAELETTRKELRQMITHREEVRAFIPLRHSRPVIQ